MDSAALLYLALLGATINVLTAGVKAALPESLHRFLPLTPLLLGALGGWLTTLTPGADTGERIVWGVLAGAFSGQAYEAIKSQLERAKPPLLDQKNGGTTTAGEKS